MNVALIYSAGMLHECIYDGLFVDGAFITRAEELVS